MVKLRTEIIVPKYFPKINPLTKARGEANPKSKIQIIIKSKDKIEKIMKF